MRENVKHVYLERLKQNLFARGIEADTLNAGLPGNSTEDARKRFINDVVAFHPDIVIIQFGINDSAVDVWKEPPADKPRVEQDKYEENIRYFIRTLKTQNSVPILMTPNPLRWTPMTKKMYGKPPYRSDDSDGFNVLLKDYAKCVRKISRQTKILLIDVYKAFYDYWDSKGKDDLLLDGMHPNDKGHKLIAELLTEEVVKLIKMGKKL